MTDQDAYTLAGWIERARKAEAALTAHGFEQLNNNGLWVKSHALVSQSMPPATVVQPAKPNGYVYPPARQLAGIAEQQAQAQADAATAIASAQLISGFQGVAGALGASLGLPPIDYDTKS